MGPSPSSRSDCAPRLPALHRGSADHGGATGRGVHVAPKQVWTLVDASAGPVASGERAPLLDALRGPALFGILVANLHAMSLWGAPDPATLATAATDAVADFLHVVLVEGKFYSLFSLLFGIGFALQLDRTAARGEGVGRYVRRLVVLLGIGLTHLWFVYTGDILTLYALVGLLLVPLRRLPNRAHLATALLLVTAVAQTSTPRPPSWTASWRRSSR